MAILKRFPSLAEIAAVYGVIVLLIYSWTMLLFFWKLPSWLNYLSIWEILREFCFAVTNNLLESLTILVIPLVLSLILPQKWFRKEFIARSTLMVAIGLGYMMYLASLFQGKEDYPSNALQLAPWVILLIILAVLLIGKSGPLCKLISAFADRTIVFLYISLPVSLICLLVVLARMVF